MTSDIPVSGLDISDTSKSLIQHFWSPLAPLLGAENTFISFRNSGETDHKLRVARDTGTGGFYARYHRSTDLTAGNPTVEIVASEADIVDVNEFYSSILYLNADSVAEGKWFIDGVDRTTSVSATAAASVAATGFDFVTFGNHPEGTTHPAGVIDHVTILQDPGLSNAKAAALATQYHDTRGLGFRPAFLGLDKNIGEVGAAVILSGTGFGLDVVVSIDGVPVDSQVRVSVGNVHDSQITFNIPSVSTGIKNLKILNVESGVAFEEIAAFAVIPSLAYAGDFGKLVLYHPLENENGDIVGPSDYDVTGEFTTVGAKFGKGFKAASSSDFFTSVVGIPGYDFSDAAKTIMHANWTPTGAGGVQTLLNMINAGFTGTDLALDYNASGGEKLKFVRNRATNLPSGKNEITIKSNLVDTTPASLLSIAAYMDSESISQGKIFVNGADETDTVTEALVAVSPRGDLLVMATDVLTFSNNANVMDELALIQDSAMTDSKMATLVANYDDARAFGYRPISINLSVLTGAAGTAVSLIGQGFGKDVQIFLDGALMDSIVRVDEGLVTFVLPNIAPGVYDLKVDNVAANVQVIAAGAFEVTSLNVIAAQGTGKRKFRVEFESAVRQVDPTESNDALNPANYLLFVEDQPDNHAVYLPTPISVETLTSTLVEITTNDDFSYGHLYRVEVRNVEPP